MANQDMHSFKEKLTVYRQREITSIVSALIGISVFALNFIFNISSIIAILSVTLAAFSTICFVYYERECMALKMAIETNILTYAMQ